MGWLLAALFLIVLPLVLLYLYAHGLATIHDESPWQTFLDILKRLTPWGDD